MKPRFPCLAALVSLMSLACLAPLPVLAAGGAGGEQPAQAGSRFQMAMTLYAGGITLGKLELDAAFRGGAYHATSTLATGGMVNALWQSEIQATSSGKMGPKGPVPGLYDSYDAHQDKKQEVSLTYENAGTPPRLYANPVYDTTGYDVKPDDQKNTVDPLSAMLVILSGQAAAPGSPCDVTVPVFDGRRRYNVEMAKQRAIDIKMDNGLYAGPGLLCSLKYNQLAGFKPHVLKAKESFPRLHAWVATVHGKDREYVVPFRVWADTPYGVVAAVMSSLKVDGAPIKTP